jgi:hypothetical protein
MLADLDETIRRLLVDELPIKNGEIDISFDQPKREWSSRIAKPTINLFLYDVRENNVLRQHQWERLNNGLQAKPGGHASPDQVTQKRTPMRVDCSYMLTTWAADPQDEHRLLTRSMLTLFRYPILPDHQLVGSLQEPTFDIQTRLASHDKLTNPTDVWNVLDNEMHPGVSYVITLALDPWSEITGPAVRTFTLIPGQRETFGGVQRYARELVPGTDQTLMVTFGGAIRDEETGDPQPGLQVAIKGTGYITTTDADGRYVLGSLAPGEYTLVVWPEEGKPVEKAITLPAEDGDADSLHPYDMEV